MMEISLQPNSKESTLSVLQIIEGLKDTINQSKLSFFQTQFFDKFKGYVYKIALHKCSLYPDSNQLALDITQETFINAFKKINTFDLSKEPNQSKHEAMLKAWMGTIANNCFNKEYAKRKGVVYIEELKTIPGDSSVDLFESLYSNELIIVPNELRLKLNTVLNKLSEEQRHIILIYADEGCINSTRHLSQNAMKNLCELYNTSSANIRQIKKRTLDKIKAYCFQTNKKQ